MSNTCYTLKRRRELAEAEQKGKLALRRDESKLCNPYRENSKEKFDGDLYYAWQAGWVSERLSLLSEQSRSKI